MQTIIIKQKSMIFNYKKFDYKKFKPYLFAIAIFVALSTAYFPQIYQGKIVSQADVSSWRGAANEILQTEKETGEKPLWTNSMFGGMPSYLISSDFDGNKTSFIYKCMEIGKNPASWICLSMISFFLLLLAFGCNPWLGIIGGIAYAFSSYNFIIIQVGHNSKMLAIALMPMVLASVVYAFRKNKFLGSLFLALSLSFEIHAKHPQIAYYLGIIIFIYGAFMLYNAIKDKSLNHYFKTIGLLVVGLILAIATNADYLMTMKDYAQYTMRGPSELSHNKDNKTKSGLDKDYATDWSYGIDETINLMIPNYKGGASSSSLSEDSEIYKLFAQQDPAYAKQVIKHMPTYWGPQPFTAGPVYIGAIMIFLFVLGLYLIKGKTKWWILTATLLSFALAWGKHFMPLTDFFLDYIPMYSKFRTVSMILVIAQLCIPLLAILSLKKFFDANSDKKKLIKGLKIASAITAGFCLIIAIIPSLAGNFTSPQDQQMQDVIANALQADRISLLVSDALRSFIFIGLAAGVLILFLKKKLKPLYAYIAIALLVLIDLWNVDKRFLNSEHFMPKRHLVGQFQERPVDKAILNDKSLDYRVLDLTVNIFNDSRISYFHKMIGGYSAGKLRRYQDMIDFHISKEIQTLASTFNKNATVMKIDSCLAKLNTLNMLNTKYIIYHAKANPIINNKALGNAWFVSDYKYVENADEEINSLNNFNPKEIAFVDKKFKPILKNQAFNPDPNAKIELISYQPDFLKYKTSCSSNQLAIFSEIYYPNDWKVYVDGKPSQNFRANYILRGMIVPSGEHIITFSFEPSRYFIGRTIAIIASFILLALLFISLYFSLRKLYERKE